MRSQLTMPEYTRVDGVDASQLDDVVLKDIHGMLKTAIDIRFMNIQ